MNQNIVEGKWAEIKGMIKARFGKLTDNDIEAFKGRMDQLAGKIQKVYGYAQEQAEKEYAEFTTSLEPIKTKTTKNIHEKIAPLIIFLLLFT